MTETKIKSIKEIKTEDAPAAIGPYSQGVEAGPFIFVSGQIPLDPESGEVVEGGGGTPIEVQTKRVLSSLGEVLKGGGATFGDVVKTTVYLTDLNDFAEMNKVYGEYFACPHPARATVEVSSLPKGVLIEIDAVALRR